MRNGFQYRKHAFQCCCHNTSNDALNPDLLQLVKKIHNNSTDAQLSSNTT